MQTALTIPSQKSEGYKSIFQNKKAVLPKGKTAKMKRLNSLIVLKFKINTTTDALESCTVIIIISFPAQI